MAGTGEGIYERIGRQQRLWAKAVVIIIGLLAVLEATTWQRSCVYATEEMLWQDAVTHNPQAWRAYINLAQAGKFDAASECYRRALTIYPDSAEADNDFGNTLMRQGKTAEAISQFEQALRAQARLYQATRQPGEHLDPARP